jgi:hypothetical protein
VRSNCCELLQYPQILALQSAGPSISGLRWSVHFRFARGHKSIHQKKEVTNRTNDCRSQLNQHPNRRHPVVSKTQNPIWRFLKQSQLLVVGDYTYSVRIAESQQRHGWTRCSGTMILYNLQNQTCGYTVAAHLSLNQSMDHPSQR